ncbi:cytochrome P450 [Streptomyces sp. NPDC001848]|uniref:cytochrome P450 n=1 Tax=Streptomyces sp. NPDC001848 TaxID=3364618 RepID=UPI00368E7817
MDDYAGPVSSTVMGEILGLLIDRHRKLVNALAQAFPSDAARMDQAPEGFARICGYAEELVALKRRSPADDLTSALIQARQDEDRLTEEEELIAMVAAVILAGSDTVRAFVGNAVLALLGHPGQARLLRERPGLEADALEELLRYEGALTTALFRVTTEELEFRGTVLPAGAPVIAALLSANRDPRRFPDPDRLGPPPRRAAPRRLRPRTAPLPGGRTRPPGGAVGHPGTAAQVPLTGPGGAARGVAPHRELGDAAAGPAPCPRRRRGSGMTACQTEARATVRVDPRLCRGTGLCRATSPALFRLTGAGHAVPVESELHDDGSVRLARSVADCCPMGAVGGARRPRRRYRRPRIQPRPQRPEGVIP